jgi:predicted outer membrane repeat protein
VKRAIRFFSVVFIAFITLPALAATLDVPSVEYPTIASAFAAAVDGDVVELAAGTYYEHDLMTPGWMTFSMVGATGYPEDVIIDAEGLGRVLMINQTNPGSRLEGITFANGATFSGAGLEVWHANLIVENCIIRGNVAEGWGGGSRAYGTFTHAEFIDCKFIDNSANYGGGLCTGQGPMDISFVGCLFKGNSSNLYGGALYANQTDVSLSQCTLVANSAGSGGAGVQVSQGTTSLDHCIISDSIDGTGASKYYSDGLLLTCCNIWNNADGNWTEFILDQLGQNGNIEADPQYCSTDASFDNLHLQGDSPCADCESSFMGCFPVDCGETLSEASSWSRLKAQY